MSAMPLRRYSAPLALGAGGVGDVGSLQGENEQQGRLSLSAEQGTETASRQSLVVPCALRCGCGSTRKGVHTRGVLTVKVHRGQRRDSGDATTSSVVRLSASSAPTTSHQHIWTRRVWALALGVQSARRNSVQCAPLMRGFGVARLLRACTLVLLSAAQEAASALRLAKAKH